MYDVLILGGGSAGMSAAIYCKRANLSCCIIDNYISGGRPLEYLEIENYLGLGKIESLNMIEKFKEHVALFDIPTYEFQEIQEVDLENKIIKTSEQTFEGKAIIIATGSRPRKLGVTGEEEFLGKGVHYCAICDGPMYKDKVVAVIGGGNSACEEALGLSKICKKVYVIEFTDKLNADAKTVEQIYNTENIEVYTGCVVDEIIGGNTVTDIKFHQVKNTANTYEFYVDGVFPYIGMDANSQLFNLEKDHGFIITNDSMETSIKGVYAVGDVRSKKYRQVITAVADGAIAGIAVRSYLSKGE